MRITVLLLVLLVGVPATLPAQPTASTSEAAGLENAGRYAEALAAYQYFLEHGVYPDEED